MKEQNGQNKVDKKYALISVSDKTGVCEFAKQLTKAGYEIISTGGTASFLSEQGLTIIPVEQITGFAECMDGRVKTLHPRIAGGVLGVRNNPEHIKAMDENKMPAIDILAVNFYPFEKAPGIENIDIGGPTMVRAAAKNYKYVTVVTDPDDYNNLFENIHNEKYRYELAAKAFRHTAAYDAHIAAHLTDEIFPEKLTLTFNKHSDMRYGENPHQEAAYYLESTRKNAELLHGKPLSYNNIADAYAAAALVNEFACKAKPACVAVKHATPCGAALGDTVFDAYTAAYECDPQAIFGGIVAFNCEVDKQTAQKMNEIFLEVIIADSFTPEAMEVLTQKKNLRLLDASFFCKNPMEYKSIGDGLLIQKTDANDLGQEEYNVVTEKTPSDKVKEDLLFAMKVVKHVKSNAIVVAKNGRLLGQGGGEVSRIKAAEAAISRAGQLVSQPVSGAVLASDAMIPFDDVVELSAKAGIIAIIQPGGSKNDQASIDAANKHGIAMVFTGVRHFKH